MTTQGTLCFIEKDGKYLMQKKAGAKFGGGRWNAPGGKSKEGESVEDCVKREVFEETGLKINKARKRAVLNFFNAGEFAWAVHVFVADKFDGRPKASEEGKLKWMDKDSLPYEDMWEDDMHWVPLIVKGKNFEGDFHFKKDFKDIVKLSIRLIQ